MTYHLAAGSIGLVVVDILYLDLLITSVILIPFDPVGHVIVLILRGTATFWRVLFLA